MRKFLLSVIVGATALTAGAASRQLLSVTEESWGDQYVTSYEYDSDGRLTKVINGESVFTFDYSLLASKVFIMTRTSTYEWEPEPEITITEMTLNDDGLVIKAIEIEDGEVDEDYYTFEYTDGYLTSYKEVSPDEVEETKITYTDGKITKVENIDGDDESDIDTIIFEYDGILNPGELAWYDNLFDIDLDDIEYVAMTGMLGKICTELPVKATEDSDVTYFNWTVDNEGYATKLEISEEWGTYYYSFEWSDGGTTGVNAVETVNNGNSQYFSIDGKKVSSDAKGVVIERQTDGKTVKRINR